MALFQFVTLNHSPFCDETTVPHCTTLDISKAWVFEGFADLHQRQIDAVIVIKNKTLGFGEAVVVLELPEISGVTEIAKMLLQLSR